MYSVLYKSHLLSNKLLIVFVSSIYYHEFPFTCPGIFLFKKEDVLKGNLVFCFTSITPQR